MAPAQPRTVSLRLSLSATVIAAVLGGGASAAVNQVQARNLADQVVELREERAANRERFTEIQRRLDSIDQKLERALERK